MIGKECDELHDFGFGCPAYTSGSYSAFFASECIEE